MDSNPIRSAGRAATRRRRLGGETVCFRCGNTFPPEAMTRIKRSLFEDHHVVGRANDPDLAVVVCLTCHRILTEGQAHDGVVLTAPTSPVRRAIQFLRGAATFFADFSNSTRNLANELEVFDQPSSSKDSSDTSSSN